MISITVVAIFTSLPQVRSRYPGVEALIRGNALHLDGRRFIWKGQVILMAMVLKVMTMMVVLLVNDQ